MNVLQGNIEAITVKGSLSLVYIRVGEIKLSSIVIDTPKTVNYLSTGHPVNVIFKETEVIIGEGTDHKVSLQNKLAGKVLSIDRGDLLARVKMETTAGIITSVITTNAVNQLHLEIGSVVTAMIKTNEIMLSE